MPLYIEYVINKIIKNDTLRKYIAEYILKECDCFIDCHKMDSQELQILMCKKVLLGFQFNFLETVRENYTKRKSHMAEAILDKIGADTIKVVETCSDCNTIE